MVVEAVEARVGGRWKWNFEVATGRVKELLVGLERKRYWNKKKIIGFFDLI